MASEVNICNMALTRLGQQRIASLTQTGLGAELSNLYYEPTVEELLGAYEWPFAISRKQLTASAESNISNYSYIYVLPNDYLRILTLLDVDDYSEVETEWLVEGRKLLTNITPCYIKYLKIPQSPSDFPQSFIEALYLRIATKMCIKMTQDQSLMNMLYQEYMAAMQSAMGEQGANSKSMAETTTLWSE